MISLDEYLGDDILEFVNKEEIRSNATSLLAALNPVLDRFKVYYPEFQIRLTSGLRSPTRNAGTTGAAPLSNHMTGRAADIDDPRPNRLLARWCLLYYRRLVNAELYCEDPRATPTWVHFQTVAPRSGARFYLPTKEWARRLANDSLSDETIQKSYAR